MGVKRRLDEGLAEAVSFARRDFAAAQHFAVGVPDDEAHHAATGLDAQR